MQKREKTEKIKIINVSLRQDDFKDCLKKDINQFRHHVVHVKNQYMAIEKVQRVFATRQMHNTNGYFGELYQCYVR